MNCQDYWVQKVKLHIIVIEHQCYITILSCNRWLKFCLYWVTRDLAWVPMILIALWPGVDLLSLKMALKRVFARSQALTDIIWYSNPYCHFFHEMKWFSNQSLSSPTLRGNIISSHHNKRYSSLHSFFIESIQLVYLNPKLTPAKVTTARAPQTPLDVCN